MRFTNSTICFKSETWRGRESMEHDYPICRIFHHRIMDSSSQPSTMYLSWLRLHWTGNYYHEFHPVCIKCGWGEWTPRIRQDKVSLADSCWFTERWEWGYISISLTRATSLWMTHKRLTKSNMSAHQMMGPSPPRKSRYVSVVFDISHCLWIIVGPTSTVLRSSHHNKSSRMVFKTGSTSLSVSLSCSFHMMCL